MEHNPIIRIQFEMIKNSCVPFCFCTECVLKQKILDQQNFTFVKNTNFNTWSISLPHIEMPLCVVHIRPERRSKFRVFKLIKFDFIFTLHYVHRHIFQSIPRRDFLANNCFHPCMYSQIFIHHQLRDTSLASVYRGAFYSQDLPSA